MAMSALGRLASAGPAQFYPAIGAHALAAVEDLGLHHSMEVTATPRHASILLVAGAVRESDWPELRRLHDQLPHPRATVWWGTEPGADFAKGIVIAAADEPADCIAGTWRRLCNGDLRSEHDLLPDAPPAPWRGEGDHGQGGEGMMGGKPYGRPMPMTDHDLRDGLMLDSYTAPFGPFLSQFPPGLMLDITLQGDVIQSARVRRQPFPQSPEPTRIASLRCIARMLRLLGLPAQAQRFVQSARAGGGTGPELRALERVLRWSGALMAVPPGLGVIQGSDVRERLRRWGRIAARPDGRELAAAEEVPEPRSRLVDLLPGLEWSEACLVLNSFEPAALRALCPVDEPVNGGEGG